MKLIQTPQFWDLHLHGVAGIDFMHATEEKMLLSCKRLGQKGVGFFAPTLLTASKSSLITACSRWGKFIKACSKKGFLPRNYAHPIGLHLEGPFLNPIKAGAHPKSRLHRPNGKFLNHLLQSAENQVAIVTLAPELPGAMNLIKTLRKKGVRVQIGHTAADSKTVNQAIRVGATGVTHLFNAMDVHHRKTGVLPGILKGKLSAELITDGIHIHPEYALWSLLSAKKQIYGVSDGCSAVGSSSSQRLTLGDLILKKDGLVAKVKKTGTLAGGATFLTSHPSLLWPSLKGHFQPKQVLELFYSRQTELFRKHQGLARQKRCYFHPKTLKFVRSVSK